MGVVGGPDPIVTDSLLFAVDPANNVSYIGSGTNTNDLRSSTTGSLNGTSFISTNGGVFDFDGNDYIQFQDENKFEFTNGSSDSAFSVSVWVNFDDLSAARGLVSKDNGNTSREWTLAVFNNSGYRARLFLKGALNGSYQQSIDTNSTFSTGVWYHITATYSGVGGSDAHDGITFYVNGVAEAEFGVQDNNGYVSMQQGTAPLEIGRYSANVGAVYMNGKISQTLIYSKELSATEVLQNYNALKDRFV
jgi:hypothetical protein